MTKNVIKEIKVSNLRSGQIHLWRLPLAGTEDQVQYMATLLSKDEQRRARRFRPMDKRKNFIMARGWLRCLLGGYLDLTPESLRFSYGIYGKPEIRQDAGVDDIKFNLSHSKDLGIVAISNGMELGVDVEYLDRNTPVIDIARRFFSPQEAQTIINLPAKQQREGFFCCWTRKEAFIKARGEGLSYPLQRFDVSVDPDQPARLITTRPDGDEAKRWSLYNLDTCPGYRAALAASGTRHHLSYFEPSNR